jgi:hypothetical protein
MSVAKQLLLEEWAAIEEPTLEQLFEEALAREDDRDRHRVVRVEARRKRIRLVVDNGRRRRLAP